MLHATSLPNNEQLSTDNQQLTTKCTQYFKKKYAVFLAH